MKTTDLLLSERRKGLSDMTEHLAMKFWLLQILGTWAAVATNAVRQRNFQEHSQTLLGQLEKTSELVIQRALLREDAQCV